MPYSHPFSEYPSHKRSSSKDRCRTRTRWSEGLSFGALVRPRPSDTFGSLGLVLVLVSLLAANASSLSEPTRERRKSCGTFVGFVKKEVCLCGVWAPPITLYSLRLYMRRALRLNGLLDSVSPRFWCAFVANCIEEDGFVGTVVVIIADGVGQHVFIGEEYTNVHWIIVWGQ